jgi:hypothetical protein
MIALLDLFAVYVMLLLVLAVILVELVALRTVTRDLRRALARRRAGSGPEAGDEWRVDGASNDFRALWNDFRAVLLCGDPIRTVALKDERDGGAALRAARAARLVLSRSLAMPVVSVALGLAGALVVAWWSLSSILACSFLVCFLVVMAWVSRRETLRADRHAAVLLGSAGPVVAMLEQMREDRRAEGRAVDRWRLVGRVFADCPPVEVRIEALSHVGGGS